MSDESSHPSKNRATGEGTGRTESPVGSDVGTEAPRRLWIPLILVGFVVAVAAVAAVALLWKGGSPTESTSASLDFAEVVTTDLVQEETFGGTLGSIALTTVTTRLGGTVTWVPEPGAALEAGDVLFVISDEPTELELAEIQQQIVMAEAEVASAQEALEALHDPPGSAAVLSAEASVATAQENLANLLEGSTEADILQAEADLATAETALADLIAGPPSSDRSLAWAAVEIAQANLDTAILQQESLAAGPVPTVLLFGMSPAWRALRIDSAPGPDIAQLEENLFALGYDPEGSMILDDVFDAATVAAVERWQEDLGAEDDGVVHLGEVVFLSGEVRITNQLVSEGSGVDPGSPVLGISLSDKVVRVDLPADQQGSLVAGDAVTVELPDSTEVPAAVVSVSQTATPSEFGPATFEVLIELDDPASAAGLDEAPVDVIAVLDSVDNVMAVPVSALVALLDGGYAVEIDAGGGVAELVAVEVGFFGSDNMIEVTSAALEPGDRVVVP